jgi:cytochrome c oxidase assembly protein subunit 15
MNEVAPNLWLHRFAVLTAFATFLLIFIGGLVTSTGSGLAVPDWPLSYGQVFPPMEGGVLYEHGHRLVATLVGLLMVILTVWMWRSEPRRWVRRLALAGLATVILQGLLGGLTVLMGLPLAVSVLHACLAQAFFMITVLLAVFTSPYWMSLREKVERDVSRSLQWLAGLTTLAVYVQLILGAVMRHMGAGMAIPDFPLAYGRLIPPILSAGVVVHFFHRLGALTVATLVIWTVARVFRENRNQPSLVRPAALLLALLVVQITLGAFTVWTRLSVLPTTAHVAGGAAVLVTSLILTLRANRLAEPVTHAQRKEWITRQAHAW